MIPARPPGGSPGVRSHDLSALFSGAAALPFIIMNIVYKPYVRGVYCNDESIKYPIKPDTITHGMLAAVTISCTVVIVSLTPELSSIFFSFLSRLQKFTQSARVSADLLWRGLSGLLQEALLQHGVQPVRGGTL